MTPCTFCGVTVPCREITRIDQLGTVTMYRFECTVACRTAAYAEYTALAALSGITGKTVLLNGKVSVQTLGGTSGTLVLGGMTYTNCMIEHISAAGVSRSELGAWDFTVSFVKDTSL
jgi:hypothetical protein